MSDAAPLRRDLDRDHGLHLLQELICIRRFEERVSAGHRVSDGHEGAHFLAVIDRLLNAPDAL